MRLIMRRLALAGLLVLFLALALIAAANGLVVWGSGGISHQADELAPVDVALVLGTSQWSVEGHPNRHFAGRMDAAAALYHAGTVRHILASGANPEIYYNEPQRMFEALLERGVPEDAITLDFAGRRTLDSVVRAQRVFGLQRFVVISQPYHLYRAMFLARAHGLEVQGFAAAQPPLSERWRVEMREVMARLLAVLDLYVLHTQAEMLGEPEPIRL